MTGVALPEPSDPALERSWDARERRIQGSELRLELGLTATFLAGALALLLLGPLAVPDPLVVVVLVGYVAASRAGFHVGAGIAVPTLPVLVTLFAVAPAALVPVLVWAALAAGELLANPRGWDRTALSGGDALHALGPAAVLVAFGDGALAEASPGVLLAALGAQLTLDLVSSWIREVRAGEVRLDEHLRVLRWTWAVDLALVGVGAGAAIAAERWPIAVLIPLPLVALLHVLALDRTRSIDAAHARFLALEAERERHAAAVDRLGAALAARLDADAIVAVVAETAGDLAGATVSVVPAEGDRRTGLRGPSLQVGAAPGRVEHLRLERDEPFTDHEREALDALAAQATIALAGAEAHEHLEAAQEQLRHRALHDGLTGLANRERFGTALEDGHVTHARTGRGLAIVFVDLDGFKEINDARGHEAGDALLVSVAEALSGCIRGPGDLAARLGGDEFALVLPGVRDLTDAAAAGERVLAALRGVTGASVGVAIAGRPALAAADLVRAADLAMYEAKRAGGGRVHVAAAASAVSSGPGSPSRRAGPAAG